MEYHQNRFEDASLLIFKNDALIGLFPANQVGRKIYSHQGLTYGGLLLNAKIKFKDVFEGFKSLLNHLIDEKFETLEVKLIPDIYHQVPSEELDYFMFLLNAKLIRKDILSVVDLSSKVTFSKDRIQGIKRAKKHNLIVEEVNTFEDFWNVILIPNLSEKHSVNPVHTLEEITLFKQQFPKSIRQFNVYHDDEIVAGTTIFETDTIAHSQYISANKDKNTLGSLDVLHAHLLEEVFAHKKYFDFGISNENNGKHINEGLLYWKEGFGARTATQDFYRIELKNVSRLNTVML